MAKRKAPADPLVAPELVIEAEPDTIPVADVTVDDAIPVGLAIEIDSAFPDARGAPR